MGSEMCIRDSGRRDADVGVPCGAWPVAALDAGAFIDVDVPWDLARQGPLPTVVVMSVDDARAVEEGDERNNMAGGVWAGGGGGGWEAGGRRRVALLRTPSSPGAAAGCLKEPHPVRAGPPPDSATRNQPLPFPPPRSAHRKAPHPRPLA